MRNLLATLPIILLIPALLLPFVGALAAGPRLSVSPREPVANKNVKVAGAGFEPGVTVVVRWDGRPRVRVTTNEDGRFKVKFRVPKNAKDGIHTVKATSVGEVRVVLARLKVQVGYKPAKGEAKEKSKPKPKPADEAKATAKPKATPSRPPSPPTRRRRPPSRPMPRRRSRRSSSRRSRRRATGAISQARSSARRRSTRCRPAGPHGPPSRPRPTRRSAPRTSATRMTTRTSTSSPPASSTRERAKRPTARRRSPRSRQAIGTENGGRTLALGRNLSGYILAANLVDLPGVDPTFNENTFKPWLRSLLTETLDGRTLRSTHEQRPNNWGTHAGASRVAIALYLGDEAELSRAATIFRAWLGDRSAYAAFSYGDLSWQCDASKPVGINPVGCTKDGKAIGGAQPEDMRRGASFAWPPVATGYPWEALQGAILQAELLRRAGYDSWNWESKALLRAVEFLYEDIGWPAEGDDEWQAWLIDARYGTSYREAAPAKTGKNFGWTDWLYGS